MQPGDQTRLVSQLLRGLPRNPIPGQVLEAAAPLRLRGYVYEADPQPLDDRFCLDQASFSTDSNGGPVEVGDSIVWRGPAQGFDAPVVWAPARVVAVELPVKGRQRVWSLQDTEAQPIDQLLVTPEGADRQPDAAGCVVRAALPQVLRDELRDGDVDLSGPMAEAVRHLFGQDDRCWRCGGVLDRVVVGLVGSDWQTSSAGRSSGNDRTVLGGCVVDSEDDFHRWTCRSCGDGTSPSHHLRLQEVALMKGVLLAWPWTQWATRIEAALSDTRQPWHTTAVAASTGHDGPILSLHVTMSGREWTARLHVRTGQVSLIDGYPSSS